MRPRASVVASSMWKMSLMAPELLLLAVGFILLMAGMLAAAPE